MTAVQDVIWHDLECGAYAVDLPLWRLLAVECGAPVIDIAAGTGRVALDLAGRGHAVIAVEVDPALTAELGRRAAGHPIETICGDARVLDQVPPAPLMIVPMQSIQLFGGATGRAAFLRAARKALRPGGVLAIAIADTIAAAAPNDFEPPQPDECEIGGLLYSSRPVAVYDDDDAVAIERVREIIAESGTRSAVNDVIRLDKLTPAELEAEAQAAGFDVLPRRAVPWTADYVGSAVVMLRA